MKGLDDSTKRKLIKEADDLLHELFPICRSITGPGLRDTLKIAKKKAFFEIKEFSSGETHYDWVIPDEWTINDAYIKDSKGDKIVDFKECNLHVMNYSIPVDKTISFDGLKEHLHFLPDLPEAIPYRTSYYNKNWGFCITHNQFQTLKQNENYQVFIDSSFKKGGLSYGETYLKGSKDDTFLIATYPCHPSLANDNLSGVVLWILLLRELSRKKLINNYQFVIHPETIGAIAFLSSNESEMLKIKGGFVISCVAGPGNYGLKNSFLSDSIVDRACDLTLKENKINFIKYPFDADAGSDERQYSSPFFKIPIVTISKDKYFEYDFYHTSLDNLDFISSEALVDTLDFYLQSIDKLEKNKTYLSKNPKCEPMLGKRELYPPIGGHLKQDKNSTNESDDEWEEKLKATNWLMYYSDGTNSLIDISEKTNINFYSLYTTSKLLCEHELLEELN